MRKSGRRSKSAYSKDIQRTIHHEMRRFLAIVIITVLGVMMFSGLRASCQDTRHTADEFWDECNLHDLSIVSTLGLSDKDIDALQNVDGIADIEGIYEETVDVKSEGETHSVNLRTLPDKVDKPYLVEGRLPEKADEVAVTRKFLKETGLKTGDTFTIQERKDSEDEEDSFAVQGFEIVGVVIDATNINNSTTSMSYRDDGKPVAFVMKQVVQEDYYTSICLTLDGMKDLYCFSSKYEDSVGVFRSVIEDDISEKRESERTQEVKSDAQEQLDSKSEEAYDELESARSELESGESEYESGKARGESELESAQERMESEIADALKDLADAQKELDSNIASAKKKLESAQDKIDSASKKLEQQKAELRSLSKKLSSGESQLESASSALKETEESVRAEISGGLSKLDDSLSDLESKLASVESSREQLSQSIAEAESGLEKMQQSKQQLEEQLSALEAATETTETSSTETSSTESSSTESGESSETIAVKEASILPVISIFCSSYREDETTIAELKAQIQQLDESMSKTSEQITALKQQLSELDSSIATLKENIEKLKQQRESLESESTAAESEFSDAESELSQKESELESGKAAVESGEQQISQAEKQISEGQASISKAQSELEDKYESAQNEIDDGKSQVQSASESAQEEYESGKNALNETLQEARSSLDEGWDKYKDALQEVREELADAQEEIDKIDDASWYVQDRYALSGYSNLDNDMASIESIGTVFPVIFFLVAILISLTAVTRMIDEDRGLIGTYKSLGFTNREILRKYLSFSFAACAVGSVIGTIMAFMVLPSFIFQFFYMMYLFPHIALRLDLLFALLGPTVFIGGICGATAVSCQNTLKDTPASLMRPKSPRAGSRVFIERITPLWKRMSFLNKVTARNLFRYKKRLFMTIAGIAGCIALLLFGFAIYDSVNQLPVNQYDDTFFYNVMATTTEGDNEKLTEYLDSSEKVKDYINIGAASAHIVTEDHEESVTLIVVPEDADLSSYIRLSDADGNELELEDAEVIVTRNASMVCGFGVGDKIHLRLADLQEAELPVTEITENYLGNFVYMTQNTYENYYSGGANAALIHLRSEDYEEAFTDELQRLNYITSATSIQSMRGGFSQTLQLIRAVVGLIVTMSAALAFVVLFTLSSTNISERERELATIKVLGFYDHEVHVYANKEMLILTVIGILIGMPLGRAFAQTLTWILALPSMYFKVTLYTHWYFVADALTMGFALIVSLVMNRVLNKIDPATALKSVE